MKHNRWIWLIIATLLMGVLACTGGKSATPEPATPVIETVTQEAPTPRPTKTPAPPTATPKPKETEAPQETEAPTAAAGASLEVINQSGMELTELYISSVEDSSWGANWLSESLAAEDSIIFQDLDEGTYDLKITYNDGSTAEIVYNVLLSDESTWTVFGMAGLPDNAVLRFEEDFTDNRNNWGNSFSDDVDYPAPADGQYCINIKVSDMTAWEWYEPFRTDEFLAEVQCSLDAGTDASCGLGFGPDGDNLFWYELDSETQSYAVHLLQDDAWQDSLIDWTEDLHINPGGANFLALSRIEGTLYVYVNGMIINWVDTDLFPTGRVGIGGATYDDAPVGVCLDDLMVWRIEK
ncbi:MAG: hypothetical protein BWY63_01985 [Chloroflexi bacterium ADurb.Bin360]|nr:MAG: hypothetical protein BWY63_01985 [Chloroflexi bacterium ADurb.Bin360]